MAVTDVKQVRARKWGTDAAGVRRATRGFRVRTDGRGDDPDLAAQAVQDELGGVAYSAADPELVIDNIDVTESASPPPATGGLYDVTVEYATPRSDGGGSGGAQNPDPTERPAQVRLSFESMEETVYRHADATPTAKHPNGAAFSNGEAPHTLSLVWTRSEGAGGPTCNYLITNSAGTATPITEVYRDPVITISKNVRTDDFAGFWKLLTEYVGGPGSVNSDVFFVTYRDQLLRVEIGTAWFADATSEPGFENGYQYEAVTVTLKIRKDGWRRFLLDQGVSGFADVDFPKGAKPKPILDDDGEPISEPVILNGRGTKCEVEDKPVLLGFLTKTPRPFRRLKPYGLLGA